MSRLPEESAPVVLLAIGQRSLRCRVAFWLRREATVAFAASAEGACGWLRGHAAPTAVIIDTTMTPRFPPARVNNDPGVDAALDVYYSAGCVRGNPAIVVLVPEGPGAAQAAAAANARTALRRALRARGGAAANARVEGVRAGDRPSGRDRTAGVEPRRADAVTRRGTGAGGYGGRAQGGGERLGRSLGGFKHGSSGPRRDWARPRSPRVNGSARRRWQPGKPTRPRPKFDPNSPAGSGTACRVAPGPGGLGCWRGPQALDRRTWQPPVLGVP